MISNDSCNALKIAIGHTLNDKQKQLHKDSAELAQLKIDAPMLFLGEADIDNRKTGRFVSTSLHDGEGLNMCNLMYKGRSDDGKLMFEGTDDEYVDEVRQFKFSINYILTRGLVHSPFDVGDKVTKTKAKHGPVGAVGTVMKVNFWDIPGHIFVETDPPYQQATWDSPWKGSTSYMSHFQFAE